MNNKIKTAFEQIHADDSLKQQTKAEVYRLTHGNRNTKRMRTRRFAVAAVCMMTFVFIMGGYFSYTTPVAAISIDVNPSLEFQINVYDRVIDVTGYNADGVALAKELSVKNMDYTDAINDVLSNKNVTSYIASDGLLEITVTGKSSKITDEMESCISEHTDIKSESIYCMENHHEVEEAHAAKISIGKYRAYLTLHEMNPDITIEDIKNLTMREIRDLTEEQVAEAVETDQEDSSGNENHGNGHNAQNYHNGSDNGHGYGKHKE